MRHDTFTYHINCTTLAHGKRGRRRRHTNTQRWRNNTGKCFSNKEFCQFFSFRFFFGSTAIGAGCLGEGKIRGGDKLWGWWHLLGALFCYLFSISPCSCGQMRHPIRSILLPSFSPSKPHTQ
ncbi:hypothetical protein QBC35DRAFT_225997 [Podospora australis]|uniref:Uncharacterized protein n=1 Tax=Podospora australis TaxID=1536484 RepID=A0AAN6X295_9PEZI|nr:hypothetical protein QBC35DRAFT_225997 [Podospora australis]